MALVLAAAFSARSAGAQDAPPDRTDAPPPARPRIAPPSSTWSPALAPAGTPDLSSSFEARLDREARRRGALAIAALDPNDDAAARGRSDSARRIFTRALNGLLDDRAESLARETPGFGDALRFFDGFGFHASSGGAGRAAPSTSREDLAGAGSATSAPASGATPEPFDASVQMRVDAHPRVELRARAGTLTGVVEVPLLEHEVRFGLEQPLGRFGKAAIRGGHSADQGDWADLVLGIRF